MKMKKNVQSILPILLINFQQGSHSYSIWDLAKEIHNMITRVHSTSFTLCVYVNPLEVFLTTTTVKLHFALKPYEVLELLKWTNLD